MKTILVTGGAGFIGTNLCISLLKKGHTVICIDNLITASGKNITHLKKYERFTFLKHDIIKKFPKRIQEEKIDQIYHLACPTGVPNLTRLSEEMLLTCSIGTQQVLDLANKKNAQVLFTSSSEVYGEPEVFPQREEYTGNVDPTGLRSPYEEGKRFSESLVMMSVRKYGVDAKMVRIFNTYGPYMSKDDTRVIPNFLQRAQKNQNLQVHGEGKQKRTFCYVDDLVKGLILVMEKGKKGEVYNIGSTEEVTIKELAQLIIKITQTRSAIENVVRPEHDHTRRMPSLKKIVAIGWSPRISLESGLRQTLEWIQ